MKTVLAILALAALALPVWAMGRSANGVPTPKVETAVMPGHPTTDTSRATAVSPVKGWVDVPGSSKTKPEHVVTIPWAYVETGDSTMEPVPPGDTLLKNYKPRMFEVDAAGNFYFVYGRSVYIFEPSGRRRAVAANIVNRAPITAIETYPDGTFGVIKIFFEENGDTGVSIVRATSEGKISDRRRVPIPEYDKSFDSVLLNDGEVYHKSFRRKSKAKVYTVSENGKNKPVRRNVEYTSEQTSWLHDKISEMSSKHFYGGASQWLGEYSGNAYFQLRGVWDGNTEHFGVLVWDKNKKVQFIAFPPVKGRGEVLDFNLNAKAPAIGSDGSVYYMVGTDSGMSVFKWPVRW